MNIFMSLEQVEFVFAVVNVNNSVGMNGYGGIEKIKEDIFGG